MLRFIIFCIFFPTLSEASSDKGIIFDKVYWENIDWTKTVNLSLWNSDSLKVFENKSGLDKIAHPTFKRREISIGSRSFTLDLVDDNAKFSIRFPTVKDCGFLSSDMKKIYGNTDLINLTYASFSNAYIEFSWQWDVGNTYILMTCSPALGSEEAQFATIQFQPAYARKEINPVFLSCSYLAKDLENNKSEEIVENFIVIPSRNVVADQNLNRINDINTFLINDSVIGFSPMIDVPEFYTRYKIDRIDGSFSGYSTLKKSGKNIYSYAGSCKNRAPSIKRKF